MKGILLIALLLLCCGCHPIVRENRAAIDGFGQEAPVAYDAARYPVSIENINSRAEAELSVYEKPPQRVVAVWQNSIETLMALGVGDRIVAGMGVPDKKYLRQEYQAQYERIAYTSLEHLDVETIRMLQPDLIVGWHSTFGNKVLRGTDFWHSRGVHTYIAPASAPGARGKVMEDEYQDILNLGKIFDRSERAEAIVRQMRQEIAFATEKTRGLTKRPRGLIIEFLGKDITVYNQKSLAGNILQSLGGELLSEKDAKLSVEQIVELDPDLIFLVIIEANYGDTQAFLDRIYAHKALRNLKCARERRVYPLPLYAVYSPGVRMYDGIKMIARGLYPELYKE